MKLRGKTLAITIATGAAALPTVSQASVLDRVFFKVLGLVIVHDGTTTSDFVLMTPAGGNAGVDLVAGDVTPVITDSLTPIPATPGAGEGSNLNIANPTSGGVFTDNAPTGVLDAADTLSAFGLDGTTDVELASTSTSHSFYVASNTAFDINAFTQNPVEVGFSLADITWSGSLQVTGGAELTIGGAAQDPGTGGSGFSAADTLDNFATAAPGTKVFDGGQATAASTGTILEQSVRFTNTYAFGGGAYDLSQGTGEISTEVVYTIFVP